MDLQKNLPLHQIPFDMKNHNEFNYWAINLANTESLQLVFSQQSLPEQLETLLRLHDALPKNHALYPFFTETLAQLIETNADALWRSFFSNRSPASFTPQFVNWCIVLLNQFPQEKLKKVINQPIFANNNLLMLITRYAKPQLISTFLEFVEQKTSKDIIKDLFLAADSEGCSVLRIATQTSAIATLRIFEFASNLGMHLDPSLIAVQYARLNIQDKEFREQAIDLIPRLILISQTQNHPLSDPFLGDALQHYPRLIINHIMSLPLTQKTALLQKTNAINRNALMRAAQHQPDAIKPLLDAISTLEPLEKAAILKQTSSEGWNALLLAARYHPDAIKPLLDAISTLEPLEKAAILKQTNKDGWNVLMFAARYQPDAIKPFLDAIRTLGLLEKAPILKQTTKEGWNLLMVAARYQPDALLLEAISALEPLEKAAILKQTSNEGWNALLLAAEYQPDAIKPLLNTIRTLAPVLQLTIFGQKNSLGMTALLPILKSNPDTMTACIEHINELARSINVKPIIETIQLEKLDTPQQILPVLKLLKNHALGDHLTQPQQEHLAQKLTSENWYTIATETLLPVRLIHDKKQMVYEYINAMSDLSQRKEALQNALNDSSELGKFFKSEQSVGFFAKKIHNSFLTKLANQLNELNRSSEEKRPK